MKRERKFSRTPGDLPPVFGSSHIPLDEPVLTCATSCRTASQAAYTRVRRVLYEVLCGYKMCTVRTICRAMRRDTYYPKA